MTIEIREWAPVASLSSGIRFGQALDGRLAVCWERCEPAWEGCSAGVVWVDVNARARLDLARGVLRLPVLYARTGVPGFVDVPVSEADGCVHLCGLRVVPERDGAAGWLEAAGARWLDGLGQSAPWPRWYGRPGALPAGGLAPEGGAP